MTPKPTDRPAKKAAAPKKQAQHKGRTTEVEPINFRDLVEKARNPDNLQVTPVEAWGRNTTSVEEGFVAKLPSGNVVRMTRTLDLAELLSTGRIPNPLAGIVQSMMEKGETSFPETNDMKTIEQLMDLLNTTFCRAVLEPRFSMPSVRKHNEKVDDYYERINAWEAPERTVPIFDVLLQDKMFVFAVAQGAAADLALFREQPGADVFSLPTVEDLGATSESIGSS